MNPLRAVARRALITTLARPAPWAQAVSSAMFQAGLLGLGYCGEYRVNRSGEAWFLRNVVARAKPRLIVDVGANRGDWSRAALAATGAQVVAFEPLPACWPLLDRIADAYPGRFSYERAGLGAAAGQAPIRYGAPDSEWASFSHHLPAFAAAAAVNETMAEVRRLDDAFDPWRRVDLVKIDVEGWEREVLAGGIRMLTEQVGRPRWVQIEWNLHQLDRGHTLGSLADLLPGYRPYLLLPRGLRPLNLSRPEDNVFSYANIIFSRADEERAR